MKLALVLIAMILAVWILINLSIGMVRRALKVDHGLSKLDSYLTKSWDLMFYVLFIAIDLLAICVLGFFLVGIYHES